MSLLGFVGRALRTAVWVLIAAGLVVFGWIWLIADRSGQEKMMMTVPLLVALGVLAVVALVTVRGPWRRMRAHRGGGAGGRRARDARDVSIEGPDRRFLSGARIPLRAETRHDVAGVTWGSYCTRAQPTDTITTARRHDGTKDDSGVLEPDTSAPPSPRLRRAGPTPPRLRRARAARQHQAHRHAAPHPAPRHPALRHPPPPRLRRAGI